MPGTYLSAGTERVVSQYSAGCCSALAARGHCSWSYSSRLLLHCTDDDSYSCPGTGGFFFSFRIARWVRHSLLLVDFSRMILLAFFLPCS